MSDRLAAVQGPAVTASLVLCVLLTIYLYYLYASSWRVTPQNIPWYFDDVGTGKKAPSWYAQMKAHLGDFNGGVQSAHVGYTKVGHLSRYAVPQLLTDHSSAKLGSPSSLPHLSPGNLR